MAIEYLPRPLNSVAPGQLVKIDGWQHVLRGAPIAGAGIWERVDRTKARKYSNKNSFESKPLVGMGDAAERAAKTLLCRLPKRSGLIYQRFGNDPPLGLRLGSDPEMFLQGDKGELLSAFQVLPSKEEKKGFFWDGFQAEITPSAAGCMEFATRNVERQVAAMSSHLGKRISILPTSTVEVPEKLLKSAKEDYVRLGCDPSYNIYGVSGQAVGDPRKLKQRWAGGHIHLQLLSTQGQVNVKDCPGVVEEVVKTLDLALGVPGVLLAGKWDSPDRRKHYGLAGEFRLPTHGIEYRTLSNFWLHHRSLAHLVFGLARGGYVLALEGKRRLVEVSEEQVQGIINTCDAREAAKLMEANKDWYLDLLNAAYGWSEPVGGKTFKFIVDCAEQGGFAERFPYEGMDFRQKWEKLVWWSTWMERNIT